MGESGSHGRDELDLNVMTVVNWTVVICTVVNRTVVNRTVVNTNVSGLGQDIFRSYIETLQDFMMLLSYNF